MWYWNVSKKTNLAHDPVMQLVCGDFNISCSFMLKHFTFVIELLHNLLTGNVTQQVNIISG